jgi:hypothetical protein
LKVRIDDDVAKVLPSKGDDAADAAGAKERPKKRRRGDKGGKAVGASEPAMVDLTGDQPVDDDKPSEGEHAADEAEFSSRDAYAAQRGTHGLLAATCNVRWGCGSAVPVRGRVGR